MLECSLNKNHTGLTLWGDYASLSHLYDLIHVVVDGSVAIEDKEGFMLGLAYDVRKAQSGQRLKKAQRQNPDKPVTYGVEILWPVVLVQMGLLRHAMGFMPTSKRHHAVMFELEYAVESAVDSAYHAEAEDVIEWIARLGAAPYQHLNQVLNSRCVYFINLPPGKRLGAMLPLLESFDPMYDFLSTSGPAKRGRIPLSAFADPDPEWPEFEW